jgi:hypothetical protein
MTPDHIADRALLTVSAWQRQTAVNRILAAWWQGKDDGLPAEQRLNDNTSLNDWQRHNEIVRGEMAHV